ncbi:MAG TPA: TonB-dependent receptor, partial [Flavobacteriales bacterium]|nr:TonB-dependent receptor [Flavobacteriales bacterium]
STCCGTKADAFTLLNAFISGKVWKYASVELGVNNLLDTNYCLVEGYPEEGRNFILTLRFQNHD